MLETNEIDTILIGVHDKEKRVLLEKCAKICRVNLQDHGDGLYSILEPFPKEKDQEKFFNSIEDRNIVTHINFLTENETTACFLTDCELEN